MHAFAGGRPQIRRQSCFIANSIDLHHSPQFARPTYTHASRWTTYWRAWRTEFYPFSPATTACVLPHRDDWPIVMSCMDLGTFNKRTQVLAMAKQRVSIQRMRVGSRVAPSQFGAGSGIPRLGPCAAPSSGSQRPLP